MKKITKPKSKTVMFCIATALAMLIVSSKMFVYAALGDFTSAGTITLQSIGTLIVQDSVTGDESIKICASDLEAIKAEIQALRNEIPTE